MPFVIFQLTALEGLFVLIYLDAGVDIATVQKLEGLKYINAFPATIIGMLDPVSASIAAFILLGETLEPLQIIGMASICGIIFYLKGHDELLV